MSESTANSSQDVWCLVGLATESAGRRARKSEERSAATRRHYIPTAIESVIVPYRSRNEGSNIQGHRYPLAAVLHPN
jgi:hypothetical protein